MACQGNDRGRPCLTTCSGYLAVTPWSPIDHKIPQTILDVALILGRVASRSGGGRRQDAQVKRALTQASKRRWVWLHLRNRLIRRHRRAAAGSGPGGRV